jgi:hypothetical protein
MTIRTINITGAAGDIVAVTYNLEELLMNVANAAISNHSGKAIAQSGLFKARVVKRVTESYKTRRARERTEYRAEVAASDFSYRFAGSIYQLFPQSEAAQQWAIEHLPNDAPRLGNSYGIEYRFFETIEQAIANAGLTIKEYR